jgi:putative DNA primase/helicase
MVEELVAPGGTEGQNETTSLMIGKTGDNKSFTPLEAKLLFDQLTEDIEERTHPNFRELWYGRAERLKEAGFLDYYKRLMAMTRQYDEARIQEARENREREEATRAAEAKYGLQAVKDMSFTEFVEASGGFKKAKPLAKVKEELQDREHLIIDIGNYLLKKYTFKTTRDTEDLYVYKDGLYREQGEAVIKEDGKAILEKNGFFATHTINEITNFVKFTTHIDREHFNEELYVNLENGLLNVKTKEFREHTPDVLYTIRVPRVYNTEAECPEINKFLSEILYTEDIQPILELIGYCLIPEYSIQTWFLFHGEGANGKSTLINLIRTFLGKTNVSSVGLQKLNDKFASYQLYCKLANMVADLSDDDLRRTDNLKALTGGDHIPAQRKFKDPFDFENYAKLIYSCNKIPITSDKSKAFYRRVYRIAFPNSFDKNTADKDLLQKLTTEEELSGLLERGYFTGTQTAEENEVVYETASNPVYGYYNERLITDPEAYEQKTELYDNFLEYCKEKRFVGPSNKKFIEQLKLFVSIEEARIGGKGKRKTVGKGVKIREDKEMGASPMSGVPYVIPNIRGTDARVYELNSEKNPDTPDTPDTIQKELKCECGQEFTDNQEYANHITNCNDKKSKSNNDNQEEENNQ